VREAEAVEGFDAVAASSIARVARVRRELQNSSRRTARLRFPARPSRGSSRAVMCTSVQRGEAGHRRPITAGTLRRIAVPVIVAGSLLTAVLFAWRNLTKRSKTQVRPPCSTPNQLSSGRRTPSIAKRLGTTGAAIGPHPRYRCQRSAPHRRRRVDRQQPATPEPTVRREAARCLRPTPLLLAKPVAPAQTADKTRRVTRAGPPRTGRRRLVVEHQGWMTM
jgi:hypothetical protein